MPAAESSTGEGPPDTAGTTSQTVSSSSPTDDLDETVGDSFLIPSVSPRS